MDKKKMAMANKTEMQARKEILQLVKEYYNAYCSEDQTQDKHPKGRKIAYAKRVFDEEEMMNLIDAGLDFWLTAGRYTEQFESELARFLHTDYCSFVNSGSSANLLAFMALTSPLLGERAIHRGDEVITVAAGFPTTVAPIMQYGAIPVFVDVTIPEYNVDITLLEQALSSKTKAIILAHTLGNPFDLAYVKSFCEKHHLWLIEDNCDSLGSEYDLDGWRFTGTIGDIGTSSFYPPHHMTTGEGGAVYTKNPLLHKIIRSLRDWGRDCICPSGVDNCCGCRFSGQFGTLPRGYDHKYVYSHLGYNLKATDMQAAIGCAQLKKLEGFIEARRHNWNQLKTRMDPLREYLILPEPTHHSRPSWFGFLMTVKENSPKTKDEIVSYLEANGIQTRALFAGNITRHPCFTEFEAGKDYRIVGNLQNTDFIMHHSFWIGVYPGLTEEMIGAMEATLKWSMK